MLMLRNFALTVAFSLGFAAVVIAAFLVERAHAEYDCSAKDDGWYYDPEFCHVYWRCIHGTSEEFECASGTAWDHHDDRCNWLDSVDCTRAKKTTAAPIVEDEEDQDITEDGTGHGEETEDDTPVVVVSKTKKKKKSNRKPGSNKRMLDGTKDEEETDGDLLLLNVCQASPSVHLLCAGRDGFFPDPEYCTRYYRCSHGTEEVFECPRGTAWDEVTTSCAWIDQVNCDRKKLGYSTSTSTEDTTTSRKKSDTESALSEASAPAVVSPANGKDSNGAVPIIECQPTGVYSVADPAECNAYYQCEKGTRSRLNCPERQLFDAEKRECTEYERVFCGTRSVNLADKNQCVNKRDGIHPDTERDCHFYYQCVAQNKMREAKCPGDQKFSSYTGKCGPPSNAPMPCGSYVPGSASKQNHRNMALFINFVLTMVFYIVFDLF